MRRFDIAWQNSASKRKAGAGFIEDKPENTGFQ